jgi:hypothetical protein
MKLLVLLGCALVAGCASAQHEGGSQLRAPALQPLLAQAAPVHDLEIAIQSIELAAPFSDSLTLRCRLRNLTVQDITLNQRLSLYAWFHAIRMMDAKGAEYGFRQMVRVCFTGGDEDNVVVPAGGEQDLVITSPVGLRIVHSWNNEPVNASALPETLAWAGVGSINGSPNKAPLYKGVMVGAGALRVLRADKGG